MDICEEICVAVEGDSEHAQCVQECAGNLDREVEAARDWRELFGY